MMLPAWRREHDLFLKLSAIQALATGPSLMITLDHVIAGQRMMSHAVRMRPVLTDYVMTAGDGAGLRRVRDAIKEAGLIGHAGIARHAARFGITNDKLRVFLETLLETRLIKRVTTKDASSPSYVWNTRRVSLKHTDLEDDTP